MKEKLTKLYYIQIPYSRGHKYRYFYSELVTVMVFVLVLQIGVK